MDKVFDLIFSMFGQVVNWLKIVPVWNNVSLYDFSLAILLLTIVSVALVNVVHVGSINSVNDTLKAERQAQKLEENRRYNLMSKTEKRNYLNRN